VFAVAMSDTIFPRVSFASKQTVLVLAMLLVEATFLPAGVVPPAGSVEFETTATSGSRMSGEGFGADDVRSTSLMASLLYRQQIGDGKWYLGIGLKAETFSFTTKDAPLPSRLQDDTAQFSLERFEGGECVAAITVNPGLYFEKHASRSAWDVPFKAVSGIPISTDFDGVLGLSNGRFYHHAVPIAGIVWQVSPHARLEAIYPAPALVLTTSKDLIVRLGGELFGGGFRTDASCKGVVEYSSYRVGATVNYQWRGWLLKAGAGVEAKRDFDFFRQEGRLHGSGAGYGKLGAEWTY
jgi:hypothetical protein